MLNKCKVLFTLTVITNNLMILWSFNSWLSHTDIDRCCTACLRAFVLACISSSISIDYTFIPASNCHWHFLPPPMGLAVNMLMSSFGEGLTLHQRLYFGFWTHPQSFSKWMMDSCLELKATVSFLTTAMCWESAWKMTLVENLLLIRLFSLW